MLWLVLECFVALFSCFNYTLYLRNLLCNDNIYSATLSFCPVVSVMQQISALKQRVSNSSLTYLINSVGSNALQK